MKKMIAALGSTRQDSSSAKVAGEVIRAAREQGYEISYYYPGIMDIKGCLGCGACKREAMDCMIGDDMRAYLQELHTCDALLVAVPNYYGQPAGHMITFLNRHFCLTGPDRRSRLQRNEGCSMTEGRPPAEAQPGEIKLVGVFAQGAPAETGIYRKSYEWYLEVFRELGMTEAGTIVVGRSSDLSPEGDVMTLAGRIGASL